MSILNEIVMFEKIFFLLNMRFIIRYAKFNEVSFKMPEIFPHTLGGGLDSKFGLVY